MLRPLALLLMTFQSLSILVIVSVLLLTPGSNMWAFLTHISQALLVLLSSAAAIIRLKIKGRLGRSRLIGGTSVLFVLGGPSVLGVACTLGLDPPEFCKFGLCALLVYLVGCLFYWVSLGDEEDLLQLF